MNEVLVSYVLVQTLGKFEIDEKIRRLPIQAAAIIAKTLHDKVEEWEEPAKTNRDLTLKIVGYLSKNAAINKMLTEIKNFRNDIDHAGVRENAINEKKFAPTLKAMIEAVEAIMV
jgi:hypothetical protein